MKKRTLSRREFISLAASGGVTGAWGSLLQNKPASPVTTDRSRRPGKVGLIDRADLVTRHNPVLRTMDPTSPLSLGNGEFAFTADVTGLQTFPSAYDNGMPLCTMSQWGWHSAPLDGLDPRALRLTPYDTHGRAVGYATSSDGQTQIYNWLRENPHRLHLGRVGLKLMVDRGREAQPSDIAGIEQKLDLWSGCIASRFTVTGKPVTVRTAVHPNLDLLAVLIESPLVGEGRLAARFLFPYGSPGLPAAEWERPQRHHSEVLAEQINRVEISRRLDADQYFVTISWSGQATFVEGQAHEFLLVPAARASRLEFVAAFASRAVTESLPTAAQTFAASARHWEQYWMRGGAIDLAASRDPRAPELERRVVLSQYLTAIQCAGSMPPQETGLTVNSWYGKFHLEMHWWHAAHFALWNRLSLLERSLEWYSKVLPSARDRARQQGYAGARWPKMTGPDGRDSPSPIGPLLIWQQPHPIFYAELCYRGKRDTRTLEQYRQIVLQTAEFMASFAFADPNSGRYVLGPPVIPVQENHPPGETWNPTFELTYWAWGLKVAQQWRERSGLGRNPGWDRVIERLSPLPVRDGVYLAHENCPETFTKRNYDHPSMLGALGMLPGAAVDPKVMRRTLLRVIKEWQWEKTWGWDYAMTAMTAARLGERKTAVDSLMMPTEKNQYLPNGHNRQRRDLPCYLPGNGGLLHAAAIMAGGWSGGPRSHAPGFPDDGSWTVRSEGFDSALLRSL
jgi:hypothetical protein